MDSTNRSALTKLAGVTYSRIVVARRTRRLDLFERHPLADQILNAVADDDHHVAVLDHVGFVADAPVPRNHVGAALLRVPGTVSARM